MRTKPSQVFDGFCYRSYDEKIDGWRVDQPAELEYPAVGHARDVIGMYDEICNLCRENWRLRQEVAHLRELGEIHYNSVLGNIGTCLTAAISAAKAEEPT